MFEKKEEAPFISTKNKILLVILISLSLIILLEPINPNAWVIKVKDQYLEWSGSYWINDPDFAYGQSILLGSDQRARMWIFGQDYYIGVLNKTNTYATITSSNTLVEPVVMYVGDEEYFEVTGDDRYDISVTFNNFDYVKNKINLTIQSTNLPVPDENTPQSTEPPKPRPKGVKINTSVTLNWKFIGIIAGIVLLVGTIISVVLYIRWKRHKGGIIED